MLFRTMRAGQQAAGAAPARWLPGSRRGETERWAVDLLRLRPIDHLLVLDSGHGYAVEAAADRLVAGRAVGVERLPAMVGRASRRNQAGIREGHIEIVHAAAEALPFGDKEFTCAVSVDSLHTWKSPESGLWELLRVLEPGGRLVLAVPAPRRSWNPRESQRRQGYTGAQLDDLEALMVSAGFRFIRRELFQHGHRETEAIIAETLRPQTGAA